MKAGRFLSIGMGLLLTLACMGQTASVFTVQHFGTLHQTFTSIGAEDGWVVGVGEQDNAGGPLDASSTSLRLGDENGYGAHQIRTILSFNTSPVPDNAIITSIKLVLKQESSVIGGGNPFQDFRGMLIDIKMGSFGAPGLEPEDFQALPDVSSFGPYTRELADTYTFELGRAAYPYINKWPIYGGRTQLRLRFVLDSDLNARPNYIHFYSGDEETDAWRPKLMIEYHLPSRIDVGWAPSGQ